MGQFSVSCKFQNVEDQFLWTFSGVYGPTVDNECHFTWDELFGVCSWWVCHGVWLETLMWLDFSLKDRGL